MRTANIFDPIEQNLDQHVFSGIDPRLSVQKFIMKVYYRALQHQLGVDGTEWADLYLTGSLTTYQFSATSDADVSVFPNYEYIWKHLDLSPQDCRRELIEMSINHLDGTFIPGTTHPLQFFVVPYGVLPTDLYQPGLRSAFDLLDRDWIVEPERSRSHDVQAEMPEVYQRAADIANKMTEMLDAGKTDAAKELWHNVHKKRQLDQRAGLGDYCEGNIVYKWLLHEGLFDRIRTELGEYIASTKISMPPANEWGQFAEDIRKQEPQDKVFLKNDVGLRWKINKPIVDQVASLFGQVIVVDVPGGYFPGYGLLTYNHVEGGAFNFKIHLNRYLSPEAANSSLWHEIQHAFQLIEGRTKVDSQPANALMQWDEYINDPSEQDADQMAAAMRQLTDLPLVHRIDWREGCEKDYYEELISEGYSEQEAEEMVDPEHTEISLDTVLQNRTAAAEDWGPIKIHQLTEPYDFRMPPDVEQGFVARMECPECHHHLRNIDGQIYCEYCGWQPRTAALPHLWDERVTTKVIYDFDSDRIILGTQATLPQLHNDAKIVGEYLDGKVSLFEADKQWINPVYFRRLWHASYPDRELKDVFFRRDSGDEYKLRSLPRKRKAGWYVEAS